MTRKIRADRNSDDFLKELDKSCEAYRDFALSMGATDAVVVEAGEVVLDPRAQMRCHSPRCTNFGKCANCPPNFEPSIEWCRAVIGSYRRALVFRIKFESGLAAGERTPGQREKMGEVTRLANEIVALIESKAFYDGYHLSMGVGAGSCKAHLCPSVPCQALETGVCRFPLKSRAAGEGFCIDYMVTAARIGWDVYTIGVSSDPAEIPCANRIGIVFID